MMQQRATMHASALLVTAPAWLPAGMAQVLCGVLAAFAIAGILFISRKRQKQQKPEAQVQPAAALTAESGSGAAEGEGPPKEEIFEQLLQEQTQRVRATAEASAAKFGAASARPAQPRPPAAIARLRRYHSHESEASVSADGSGADLTDMPPNQAAHRDSPSSRYQRDYRVWGRQHAPESPTAPSLSSTDPSRGVQLPRKPAPQPGSTGDTDNRGNSSRAENPPKGGPGRAAGQKRGTEWNAPGSRPSDQETRNNSGSRRAQGKSAGQAGSAATARKGTQRPAEKYQTEGKQTYIRSGVWRAWGPAGAAHEPEAEDGDDMAVKPDQAGAGKTGSEGVASRPPVETPISYGLYARSYASVKGKLSPALRSQPGKAPGKNPTSLDSAKPACANPDLAGGTTAAFGNIVPSRKSQAAGPEHQTKLTDTEEKKEKAEPPAEQKSAGKDSAEPPPDTGPGEAKPHRVLGREGVMKMTHAVRGIAFPLF
ncbi:hypothetical protein COCOBI_06-5440 [Coccomyxa sp. Obi]|nr:hypothetical protein COCOBI_06-5440 [Coccomyxa sp. Obi]